MAPPLVITEEELAAGLACSTGCSEDFSQSTERSRIHDFPSDLCHDVRSARGAARALRGRARRPCGRSARSTTLFIDGAVAMRRARRSDAARSTACCSAAFRSPRRGRRRGVGAAAAAFPRWRARRSRERARLLRRAARLMEQRVYDIAAALALEVGKNRMEALGEAQETADLFRHYADESSARRLRQGAAGRSAGRARARNRSVLKPYGVWLVIAPFNFPFALAGGPVAAALVTGNTVVFKGASDTPWTGRLLADCLRDAGLPPASSTISPAAARVGEALVATRAWRASRSPARTGRHAASCGTSPPALSRGPASPRWAARTRASSPRTPTSTAPRPASCARPSACRAEVLGAVAGLRRALGGRCAHSSASRRSRRRSASATRACARTGWAR